MAISILTPHDCCDLTPPKRGTKLKFGLERGPYNTYTAPRINPHPQRFGIDPTLGVVATKAPATSEEESPNSTTPVTWITKPLACHRLLDKNHSNPGPIQPQPKRKETLIKAVLCRSCALLKRWQIEILHAKLKIFWVLKKTRQFYVCGTL